MLHYTTYHHKTSKDWVTFVHGAGGSSTIWFKQLRDFRKHFNILLLDLRGHGNSKPNFKDAFSDQYTFDSITEDIVEVMDHEKIAQSHFIGISLGTILIRNLAENHPSRVKSMIMGGAIMKLNFRSQVLMRLGVIFKSVVPYLWLYKFFAFIIMPNKNHRESRSLFVQNECSRRLKLASEITPLLRFFRTVDISVPTFYVMGEEDYLFLPTIQKIVKTHKEATLFVIEKCGHVVNVEQPNIFNQQVIGYLTNLQKG